MLQFGGTFGITTVRHIVRSWHLTATFVTSSIMNTDAMQNVKMNNMSTISNDKIHKEKLGVKQEKADILNVSANDMSKQSFNKIKASLIKHFPDQIDLAQKIQSANSVNDLLKIASLPDIDTNSVIKIISAVTVLSQNLETNSKKFPDTTKDSHEEQVEQNRTFTSEILQFIKSPEEIHILSGLSINQLVQVLSYLRLKKNRNPLILREVSKKISKSSSGLNIKQSADVLYSLTRLNFPHEDLLQKITLDLVRIIPKNDKPFVINSILTSIGKLHFRDEKLLDVLCKWILKNQNELKTESFLILLQTLAVVGYKNDDTIEFIEKHIHPLKASDMSGMAEWIDLVWSLSVLDQVKPTHLSSVLNQAFLEKVQDIHGLVPKLLKLLNINAVAELCVKDYNGPFISKENSQIFGTNLKRSKEEEMAVMVMAETLRNVFPSTSYFKTNINLGMGFFIDAECAFDRNLNPLDVNDSNVNSTRIAIIKYGYNHYCRGENKLLGLVQLQERLLKAAGYKILAIPHDSFSKKDKLADRVKYINDNLKSVAKQSFA